MDTAVALSGSPSRESKSRRLLAHGVDRLSRKRPEDGDRGSVRAAGRRSPGAHPLAGDRARARQRRRRAAAHRRDAGLPRVVQRPAQVLLRPAAPGRARGQDRDSHRDRRAARRIRWSSTTPSARSLASVGGLSVGHRHLRNGRAVRRERPRRLAARERRPGRGRGAGGDGQHVVSIFEPRLGIYYEHPDWYRPLFAELDRRGVAVRRAARRHAPLRSRPSARRRTRSSSTA